MAETQSFITIVSGLPRSGTSMMMRILEVGGWPVLIDHIRQPDIDNPNGYYEFEPVKKVTTDVSWLGEACGKAVKIVYRLLYHLPKEYSYRVVFMRRRLEEILASQETMLQRLGKTSDVPDERMKAFFSTQLERFEGWIQEQPNFKILYVDYQKTVEDPASTAEVVSQFLDAALNVAEMVKVVEPSLYRQRKSGEDLAITMR